MESTTSELGTQKIPRLIFSLAIPSIIAQVVNLIYSLVDRIYIGRMENATLSMSALVVSLPVVTIVTAFTALIGTGGAPLAAMKLGEGNDEYADKILTNSFVGLTISAVVLTGVLLIFQEPFLYLFGATPENIKISKSYVGIYSMGTIFVHYALGLNAYINTQGKAKFGMFTVIIGAVLNIILDPIFIFVLGMGVKGAAYATVIAQAVSAIWVLWFFFSPHSKLKISKQYFKPDWKVIFSIMAIGVSPFVMGITESFLQITFNTRLGMFGGTLAVGSFAVLLSCYQMLNSMLNGLCQGAQPVLSYNYGAGNLERVRLAFQILFKTLVALTFIGFGSILVAPHFFASIFAKDSDTIVFASWALRVYNVGGLVFGVQIACQQSFLALGEAKKSLFMAVFRKIIVLIPLIYFLPECIGDTRFAMNMAKPISHLVEDGGKVFAILLAETVADVVASITTGTLFFLYYKKHLKGRSM